jgi:hypothetical protein
MMWLAGQAQAGQGVTVTAISPAVKGSFWSNTPVLT